MVFFATFTTETSFLPKKAAYFAHNHFKNFLEAVEMSFRSENRKRWPLELVRFTNSLPAHCDQPSQIQFKLHMNKVFSAVISVNKRCLSYYKNSGFSFCFQIFVAKFRSRKLQKYLIFDISSIYFILRLKALFIFYLLSLVITRDSPLCR